MQLRNQVRARGTACEQSFAQAITPLDAEGVLRAQWSRMPRSAPRSFVGVAAVGVALGALAAVAPRVASCDALGASLHGRLGYLAGIAFARGESRAAPLVDHSDAVSFASEQTAREHFASLASLPVASPAGPTFDDVLHLVVERRVTFAPELHITFFSGKNLFVANLGGARVSLVPNGFSPQQGGLLAFTGLF
jgi:hypothetical protein